MSWADWEAEAERAEKVRQERHDAAMLKQCERSNFLRFCGVCLLLCVPLAAFAVEGTLDELHNGRKVTDWVIKQDDQTWIASEILHEWKSEVQFVCDGELITVRHPDSITQRKYRVKK